MDIFQSIGLYCSPGLVLAESSPLVTLDIPDQAVIAALNSPDFFDQQVRPDQTMLALAMRQQRATRPSYFFFQQPAPAEKVRQGDVGNAMLARLIKEEKGDWGRAAKRAGLAESTVKRRVEEANVENPLFSHKRKRIYSRVDDVTLAAALAHHHGNRRKAAKEAGLSPSSVTERILRAEEGSPLFPYKTQKGIGGHPKKVSDAVVGLDMRQHGNNAAAVARIHGVSPSGLNTRIRKAPDDNLHLAPLKGRRVEKKPPRKRKIAANVMERKFLLTLHMQAAPDASPIARIATNRVSDAKMAEVLAKHPLDIPGAATELGVIPEVILKRLKLLEERPEWQDQSPLAQIQL